LYVLNYSSYYHQYFSLGGKLIHTITKESKPYTGLDRPFGLQEVKKVPALSIGQSPGRGTGRIKLMKKSQ